MTATSENTPSESDRLPPFCPACGANFRPLPDGGLKCRACGLTHNSGSAAPRYSKPGAPPPHGAGAAIIGRLEHCADPAQPLLAARETLGPGGVLYLEIGAGGIWAFPKRSLMLLMERCGFRLIRKFDRDGRRGLYRRY